MAANFVLGSTKSSTYPEGTPPVFVLPEALLESHFEHPRCFHEPWACDSKKRSASMAAIQPEPAAVTAWR